MKMFSLLSVFEQRSKTPTFNKQLKYFPKWYSQKAKFYCSQIKLIYSNRGKEDARNVEIHYRLFV